MEKSNQDIIRNLYSHAICKWQNCLLWVNKFFKLNCSESIPSKWVRGHDHNAVSESLNSSVLDAVLCSYMPFCTSTFSSSEKDWDNFIRPLFPESRLSWRAVTAEFCLMLYCNFLGNVRMYKNPLWILGCAHITHASGTYFCFPHPQNAHKYIKRDQNPAKHTHQSPQSLNYSLRKCDAIFEVVRRYLLSKGVW